MTRSFAELVGLDHGSLTRHAEPRRFDVIFLDRDGTLNVHRPGYIENPEQLELLPGVPAAIQRCAELAHRVVVVTNQRGIARGVMTSDDLARVHGALDDALSREGARLDAYGVCPHEENSCPCRKPKPGLLLDFLARMPWADPARCLMFGDQDSDAAAAQSVGVPFRRISPRTSLSEILKQIA